MAISFPVFPTLLPAQSFTLPVKPLRWPSWDVKRVPTFSNQRQQTVSGRTLVVKYWINPLWQWELTYENITDNPSSANPYYTVPISATDMEILVGFYCGMQGQGNEFAFQPPDSIRGGSFTITSASALTANIAVLGINPAISVGRLRMGDGIHISGLSTATYLNGQNGVVIGRNDNPLINTVTLSIPTSGTHAAVTDSGTAVGGQILGNPDINGNVEVVNTIGSYPFSITPAPTMVAAKESVQLIDLPTLTVYGGNGANLNANYTVAAANTIAGYEGLVLQFGGFSVTAPLMATFTYFYICRFTEDTQEYDNFMAMLWKCSSVKFGQVRI